MSYLKDSPVNVLYKGQWPVVSPLDPPPTSFWKRLWCYHTNVIFFSRRVLKPKYGQEVIMEVHFTTTGEACLDCGKILVEKIVDLKENDDE